MPLASRLASAGAGAPPYPSAPQPGYSPSPGYASSMSGNYNAPQSGYAPQQYPPPPSAAPQYGGGGGYGAQSAHGQNPSSYGQNYQSYDSHQYQQGPYASHSHGYGPPGPQYGAPPPGQYQYGAPPPGQHQHNAPPHTGGPGPGASVHTYRRALEMAIVENNLQHFYPPGPATDQTLQYLAECATRQVPHLAQAWNLPLEIANDIVRLALYDVVIFIDDSGSMEFSEGGSRIDDLKLILERVVFATALFDTDGIEIRAMNRDFNQAEASHKKEPREVHALVANMSFKGLTPFGTQLRGKVVDNMILPRLQQGHAKPFLVIGITDGAPTDSREKLAETIDFTVKTAARIMEQRNPAVHIPSSGPNEPRKIPGAVAFQFAQVGNDEKAREYLAELDNDYRFGDFVDCTSNYENESAEMSQANPPVNLTPDLWIMKLIMGAIDKSYDRQDEKSKGPGNNAPQPGFGGQPPYNSAPHYNQGSHGGQPPYNPNLQGGQTPYNNYPPGGSGYNPGYGPSGGQHSYDRPPPQPPQGQYQGFNSPQPPRYS